MVTTSVVSLSIFLSEIIKKKKIQYNIFIYTIWSKNAKTWLNIQKKFNWYILYYRDFFQDHE